MSSNVLNGGQVIVDYLVREKVPYVFGLCGHGNIGFLDALYERADDIKTISVHHESVAGFMADVYYRVCGKPTATFTSCGPGSANLPIALANSYLDSVPFLAVTGNVPTGPIQPRRVPGALSPLPGGLSLDRARLLQARVPADARRHGPARDPPGVEDHGHGPPWAGRARRSLRHLQGSRRRGDPQAGSVERQHLLPLRRRSRGRRQGRRHAACAPSSRSSWSARASNTAAPPPTCLRLAERLRIPVAWSASGTGAIDARHPLALGLIARNGPYQANHAARTADVLLALGVRFDDRTSSSWLPGYSFTIPPTKLIHVDIDPDEIARNYPVALGLMADVRTFLHQVLAELDARDGVGDAAAARAKWLDTIEGYRRQWNAFIAPGFVDDGSPIHPQRAAHEIDKALPEDAILVSDIGVHHNWLIQFCNPRRPDSLIGSMGFGPMGFGVAGVLGAQFAAPERPCVSVCGDGAFFMHASVLGTAVEYDLPVVWVVWNNFAYASIRGLQRGYLGGRELATDFRHPDDRRAVQSRLCRHGALGRHRRA